MWCSGETTGRATPGANARTAPAIGAQAGDARPPSATDVGAAPPAATDARAVCPPAPDMGTTDGSPAHPPTATNDNGAVCPLARDMDTTDDRATRPVTNIDTTADDATAIDATADYAPPLGIAGGPDGARATPERAAGVAPRDDARAGPASDDASAGPTSGAQADGAPPTATDADDAARPPTATDADAAPTDAITLGATPDDAGLPEAVCNEAARIRKLLPPSERFVLRRHKPVDGGSVPFGVVVSCSDKEYIAAGVGQNAQLGGGGNAAKDAEAKPSFINFLRVHFGWTLTKGLSPGIGNKTHREAAGRPNAPSPPAAELPAADDNSPDGAAASSAAPSTDGAAATSSTVRATDDPVAVGEKNAKIFATSKTAGAPWTGGLVLVRHGNVPFLLCECEKLITARTPRMKSNAGQHRDSAECKEKCNRKKRMPNRSQPRLADFLKPKQS